MPDRAALELLIRLLKTPPDVAILEDPLSWEAIRAQSVAAGLAPAAAYVARGYLPAPGRAWCDQVLTSSWNAHLYYLSNAEFVLGVLAREGIRTIPLKGPCLAARYYEPPFLRKPSTDLDFAVCKPDLARACGALGREGYSVQPTLARELRFSHHIVLTHSDRPRLELHFKLTHGSKGMDVEEFFERALPYRTPGGCETVALGKADEILHLALHTVSGRFKPFFHLYELRKLQLRASAEEFEEAVKRAEANHFAGAFCMVDVAFRSVFGEPFLPATVRLRRPWLHRWLNEQTYQAFEEWADLKGKHTVASRLKGRWLDIQTTDRPVDAARQLGLLLLYGISQISSSGWRNIPVGGRRKVEDS